MKEDDLPSLDQHKKFGGCREDEDGKFLPGLD